ncbi:site-specific integrase [Pseudomonas sp. N40(2020)]|uniref:site-specific integrase n=1 Tax=Pseudomonas sp. N40(2020) TaxID=2767798 RepID=UPI001656BFAF|nr:site-specific integrase [Pseudomonas sp. N40(2020)]MBC8998754.1 site-specific integrase [Pseudomonas sp. N40(2020)]
MEVVMVEQETGERLPMILGADGLPDPAPNEWLLSRRGSSTNTLLRNARELAILVSWLEERRIDFVARIRSEWSFTEAELKGSLVERLRHSVKRPGEQSICPDGAPKWKLEPVAAETFNQRLTTVNAFFSYSFDLELGQLSSKDPMYLRVQEHKAHVNGIFARSFVSDPGSSTALVKDLEDAQLASFKDIVSYRNPNAYGVNEHVRFRNYICSMIMLRYGLRIGELLSLRLEDIVFGRISEICVVRRPDDPRDTRRPRPKVKRLARQLPIDEPNFAKELAEYIEVHREAMMEAGDADDHYYLIVSDEGAPLHLNSLAQYFRILRARFPVSLPRTLSAHMLRHTFSTRTERQLCTDGYSEEERKKILAGLRGDSSLSSQDPYVRQEAIRRGQKSLRTYHEELLIPEF